MSVGKFIVIEGSDGCGKQTQSKKLVDYINNSSMIDHTAEYISFPNYDSQSSGPVQMYLNGELGGLDDVNAYQASLLYAVDRFCTIRAMNINQMLKDGKYIICDRYVESNMIHQAAKVFGNDDEIGRILDYIYNIEYIQLKLPVPDMIFFLDVKPEVSEKLKLARNEAGDTKTGSFDRRNDIHETNHDFMIKSYLNGINLAHKMCWKIIDCNNPDNTIKPVDVISRDIVYEVLTTMNI